MLTTLAVLWTAIAAAAPLDADVATYVARAAAEHPALAAAAARTDAAEASVAGLRAFPDPMVRFGGFVSPVETRVGPQRARVGVEQRIPWPGVLAHGADAGRWGTAQAEAGEAATARAVEAEVRRTYWDLWALRRMRAIHEDHLVLLAGLTSTLEARVEVGDATFAELQQVGLSRAQVDDRIASMVSQERRAAARLRAAVGMVPDAAVPTVAVAVAPQVPEVDVAALREAARSHPSLGMRDAAIAASAAQVRRARAARAPDFVLSLDWIVTDPVADTTVVDRGKDAVFLGAGVRVPLSQGTAGAAVAAAEAQGDALAADREAAVDAMEASAEAWAAEIDDTARRIAFTRDTLLPQATSTYDALLGTYASGRGSVAQVMLAQQDLLALRVALEAAVAAHAQAWAALDEICGDVPRVAWTPEAR